MSIAPYPEAIYPNTEYPSGDDSLALREYKNRIYFGTAERMGWIPCPTIEAGISSGRWSSRSNFLNGGAHVRRSSAVHRTYSFNWSLQPWRNLSELVQYDEGLYGDGPFYFLLPGTFGNILPQNWAAPRVAAKDAMPLVGRQKPSLMPTSVPSSTGYPTASAHYAIPSNEEVERAILTLPLPPGHILHLGVNGQYSGDAAVCWRNGSSGEWSPIGPLPIGSYDVVSTPIEGPGFIDLSIQGSGTLTLNALTAAVTKYGQPMPTRYYGGRGHSGVQFDEEGLDVTMYSAVKDLYHASAQFVEVGAWS